MSQQQQQQDRLINVGAGWQKESQAGKQYFSFKFNQDIKAGTWLKGFWVDEKSSERAPDLSIAGNESDGYVAEQREQDRQQQNQGQPRQGNQNRGGGQQQQNRGGQQQNQGQQRQGNQNRGGGQQQQNRGGQQQQQRRQRDEFQDELDPDQIPF